MRLAALLACVGALAVTVPSSPAAARRVHGARIPDPSDPVPGEGATFVVRRPWARVLRELRRTYGKTPGVVIRRVDTPPSVKAFYVENTRRGRAWDGINVYEVLRSGTVYVSVLPARKPR